MFMINLVIWTPITIMMIGKIVEMAVADGELRKLINKMELDETIEG